MDDWDGIPEYTEEGGADMSTELIVPAEEFKQIETKRKTLVEEAEAMEIVDEKGYDHAVWFRQEALKKLADEIKRVFDPICDANYKAWKQSTAARKEQYEPVDTARKIVSQKMNRWKEEQDRLREIEEEKQRAARMKQLEEMKKKEEDVKLEQAESAEASGNADEAEQILDMPSVLPDTVGPVAMRDTTKRKGITYRDHWMYEVVNSEAVPDEYKAVDHKKLGAVVRATKGTVRIHGVRIWSEKRVAG